VGHFDTWKVNTDAEYHEGSNEDSHAQKGRAVPQRVGAD
jgi:hypothetical protein